MLIPQANKLLREIMGKTSSQSYTPTLIGCMKTLCMKETIEARVEADVSVTYRVLGLFNKVSMSMIERTRIAVSFAILILPINSFAGDSSDWTVSLDLAIISMPTFLGDDMNRTALAPNVSVSYKDSFFASLSEGLGFYLVNKDGWRSGPVVKYQSGRKEDGDEPQFVHGDDSRDLMGLGDVGGTVELGGFVTYTTDHISAKLEIRQGLDGHKGISGETFLNWTGTAHVNHTPWFFSIGPEVRFGDSDYIGTFFDVSPQQSSVSGLAVHDANGGLVSYGIHSIVAAPITSNVSWFAFGIFDVLSEALSEAPLVSTRGSDQQTTVGIGLNIAF